MKRRKYYECQSNDITPLNEDQLEDIKKQIIETYLFLISRTGYDPRVIEIMKLSALADVQRRFEAGEPW